MWDLRGDPGNLAEQLLEQRQLQRLFGVQKLLTVAAGRQGFGSEHPQVPALPPARGLAHNQFGQRKQLVRRRLLALDDPLQVGDVEKASTGLPSTA